MRMLKTPVEGKFIDLRTVSAELPREQRWSLGNAVPADVHGILFRPAERPTATAIAVLKGQVLGRSIQTTHYRFEWNSVRIDKLYAFDEEGILSCTQKFSRERKRFLQRRIEMALSWAKACGARFGHADHSFASPDISYAPVASAS